MSSNLLKNRSFDALIIEDEPILAMAMEMKLKKMGLCVSAIANNPDNAILHAQNHFPDIAIVDINLNSSKSGIDVANYLWKNFNIPIIFLTSYYNDKLLKQAMDCEPYAYLLKPCRYKELEAAISMAINKHQYFFKNKKSLRLEQNEYIYINENTKFDKTNSELFVEETLFKLTRNEKKLFEILTQNSGRIVNFDTIFSFIWREDVYDLSKLRSLIYRLKNKLGFNPFESFYEEGYRITILEKSA